MLMASKKLKIKKKRRTLGGFNGQKVVNTIGQSQASNVLSTAIGKSQASNVLGTAIGKSQGSNVLSKQSPAASEFAKNVASGQPINTSAITKVNTNRTAIMNRSSSMFNEAGMGLNTNSISSCVIL